MPSTANKTFDPASFAKLMASFDTSNACEAEAISAARAMRRMAASHGWRVVDVLERDDVKKALDVQLQPVREDSAELKQAFIKITHLATVAKRQEEVIAELRREIAGGGVARPGANVTQPQNAVETGLVNGWLVAVMALAVAALLVAASMH
jgi:hypothetical protein